MPRKPPNVDEVYDWAVENGVPAPDAFAVRHWDLEGKTLRLRLYAASWRRQVAAGTTGFPQIDGENTEGEG